MQSRWLLDENTGVTAVNVVVGPDFTLQNGAAFNPAAGRLDGAVSFDGVDDKAEAGDVLDPFSGDYSVGLWFKRPSGGTITSDQFLISKGNRYSTREGWSINIAADTQEIRLRVNSSDSTAQRASTEVDLPLDDEWHHLTMVVDRAGGRIRGYLDGSNAGWRSGGGGPSSSSLSSITDIDTTNPLALGAVRDGANTYYNFNGLIDDVRVYDRVLTAGEAFSLAHPPELENGLLAHYRADESSGTTTSDELGTNDLTLVNGAAFDTAGGRLDGAISLDGVDDRVEGGDTFDPESGDYSVSLWFKRPQGGALGSDQVLIAKGNRYSTNEGWSVNFSDATQEIRFRVNSSDSSAERASTEVDVPQDDQWHHLVLVIDRADGRVRGYLDGSNAGWRSGGGGPSSSSLASVTDINTPNPFTIGAVRMGTSSYYPFKGLVDEVRLYDRVLTEGEIAALGDPVAEAATAIRISGNDEVEAYTGYSLGLHVDHPGIDPITEWIIDWGDGTTPEVVAGNPTSVTHVYETPSQASYTVTATATDGTDTYTVEQPLVLTVTPSTVVDTDEDGLVDFDEQTAGTDPTNPDTDGDLFQDGFEVTNYNAEAGYFDALVVDDGTQDYDADRLFNYDEYFVYGTNPATADTDGLTLGNSTGRENPDDADGDLLADDWEVVHGLNPLVANGSYYYDVATGRYIADYADTDNDGLNDLDEFIYGGDPGNPDTDGDGINDSAEFANGTSIGLETYSGNAGQGGSGQAFASLAAGGGGSGEQAKIPLWVTIGDWSPSESELWRIKIGDTGWQNAVSRTDTIPTLRYLAPGTYSVKVEYVDTNRPEDSDPIDWRALIRDNSDTPWNSGNTWLYGLGYSISGDTSIIADRGAGGEPTGTATLTVQPIQLDQLNVQDATDPANSAQMTRDGGAGSISVPLDVNGHATIKASAEFSLDEHPTGTQASQSLILYELRQNGSIIESGNFGDGLLSIDLPQGGPNSYELVAWVDGDGTGEADNGEQILSVTIQTEAVAYWELGVPIQASEITGPNYVQAGSSVQLGFPILISDIDYLFPEGQDSGERLEVLDHVNIYQWSGQGVSSDGVFTAPTTPGTYVVTLMLDDEANTPAWTTGSRDDEPLYLQKEITVTVPSSVVWDPWTNINTSGVDIEMAEEYVLPGGQATFSRSGSATDNDRRIFTNSMNEVSTTYVADTVSYRWEASAGVIDENGVYNVPEGAEEVTISLIVNDGGTITTGGSGSRNDAEEVVTRRVRIATLTSIDIFELSDLGLPTNQVSLNPDVASDPLFITVDADDTYVEFSAQAHTENFPAPIDEFRWTVTGPDLFPTLNNPWLSGERILLPAAGGIYTMKGGFDIDGNTSLDTGIVEGAIVVLAVDLDADSDNSGSVERSDEEELLEQVAINAAVVPVSQDQDNDGIPDGPYADLKLELSSSVQEADPTSITLTFGGVPTGLILLRNGTVIDPIAGLDITPGETINDLRLAASEHFGTTALTVTADVQGSAWSGLLSDTVHIQTFGIDLDIDTNGDGVIDDSDEAGEDTFTGIGQLVSVNSGDNDADLIPDFIDGFDVLSGLTEDDDVSNTRFLPLRLTIPQDIPGTITFNYNASDPAAYVSQGLGWADLLEPAQPQGVMRIWTVDGNIPRLADPVAQGGDFLAASVISLDDLRGSFGDSEQIQFDLFVEVVGVPDSMEMAQIEAVFTPDDPQLLPLPVADKIQLLPLDFEEIDLDPDGIARATAVPAPALSTTLTPGGIVWDGEKFVASLGIAGQAGPNPDESTTTVKVDLNEGSPHRNILPGPSGAFNHTFIGVNLHEGWNTIYIVAESSSPQFPGKTINAYSVEVLADWPDEGGGPTNIAFGEVVVVSEEQAEAKIFVRALELLAPADAPAEAFDDLSVTLAGGLEAGFVKDGDHWLAQYNNELLRLGSALDLNEPLPPYEESPTPGSILERIDQMILATGDAAVVGGKFTAGFVVGVGHGGVGLAKDGFNLIRVVKDDLLTPLISSRIEVGYKGEPWFSTQLGEDALDFFSQKNLQRLGLLINQVYEADAQTREDILFNLAAGDWEGAWEDAGHYRLAIELGVELIGELAEATADMDAYERGRLTGRVVFELLASVGKIGEVGRATKAASESLLGHLARKPFFQTGHAATALSNAQASINAIPTGMESWGSLFVRSAGKSIPNTPAPNAKMAEFFYAVKQRKNGNKWFDGVDDAGDAAKAGDLADDFIQDIRVAQKEGLAAANGDPSKWYTVDELDQVFGGRFRNPNGTFDPNPIYPNAPLPNTLSKTSTEIHHGTPQAHLEHILTRAPYGLSMAEARQHLHVVSGVVLSEQQHVQVGNRIAMELRTILENRPGGYDGGALRTTQDLARVSATEAEIRASLHAAYSAEIPGFESVNGAKLQEVLSGIAASGD